MNKRGAEIRVGITLLVALIVLVGGIMWGKGYKIKAERYPRVIHFSTISGLETGARVLVNGVNKGKVDDINLYPDHVEVRIQLDKDVILYNDAKIFIDSPELMGGKVISIFPGSSGIHASPEVPLKGSPAVGMTELMAMAGDMRDDVQDLLVNLNTTLISINETIGDPKVRENLQSSLKHLDQASQKLDRLIEESSPHIASAATVLDSTVRKAKSLITEHEQTAVQTLDNLSTVSVDLKEAIRDLKDITATVKSGEGTLGKLVYEETLYQRIDSTLVHVDSLIAKFQREGVQTKIHLFGK